MFRNSTKWFPFQCDSEIRKRAFTASEASAYLCLHYNSRKEMMAKKFDSSYQSKPINRVAQYKMDHGKNYEQEAIDKFLKAFSNSYSLIDNKQISYQSQISTKDGQAAESFYIVATPDAILIDNKTRELVSLEVKCPEFLYKSEVDIRNEEIADTLVVIKYYIQSQAQILTLGFNYGILVIYVPSFKFKDNFAVFKIDRDEVLHKILLDNYNQALKEKDDPIKWRAITGEKTYYMTLVLFLMTHRVHYLSNHE